MTTFTDTGGGADYTATPSGNNDSSVEAVELAPLRRMSQVFPLPAIDKFGHPDTRGDAWVPTSTVRALYGYYQVVIDGVDVTYFRGVPTVLESMMFTEPFDDAAAQVYFPQVGWLHRPSHQTLSWLRMGADIDIYHVLPNGSRTTAFEGLLVSNGRPDNGVGIVVQALGALYQADLTQAQPRYVADEIDIGPRVAELLNTVPSRNYATCAAVTTGVTTNKRGSWGPRLSGAVQELLAEAWTDDRDNQWTVRKLTGRKPVVKVKDRTTQNWTVSFGAPGILIDIRNEYLTQPNTVYGEGVAPDGGRWRNTKYPGLRNDTAPLYPLAPSDTYQPGETETGWSTFVDRMELIGYSMASTGNTYAYADEPEVRDIQRRRGIQVDGIVGPQTWSAVFDVGSDVNPDALKNVYAAPLAVWTEVEPYLYHADGSRAGANPNFNPTRVRVERYENFGEGVTKKQAVQSAVKEIGPAAHFDPNWVGTFTFTADPEEGSRWDIRAGHNIWVRYLTPPLTWFTAQGKTPTFTAESTHGLLLHVSRVTIKPGGEVTGDLSWLPYDLVTLADLRRRNRDNDDPARRSSRQRRRSKQQEDQKVIWDAESGAGVIPRHAIFGGLWTVLRIPAGEIGSIAKSVFTVDSPLTEFYVGVFEEPVTANWLADVVGNPDSGGGWHVNPDTLADAGLLVAWGQEDQPMGYYPKLKSDEGSPPITGRFVDAASWQYWSKVPPWLWVAEFSPNSCFIKGRLYPAENA